MSTEILPLKPTLWFRYTDDTFIHLTPPGKYANTAGPCELNKTFYTVHNAKTQLVFWINLQRVLVQDIYSHENT